MFHIDVRKATSFELCKISLSILETSVLYFINLIYACNVYKSMLVTNI